MANPVKSFFLFCSGAAGVILRKDGCGVEYNKYAGIGATIFFTAALASLSGGYAMFRVFHDLWAAAGFGSLWGLIIFNLDRFIVSSMRKKRAGANLSLGRRLSMRSGEFAKALPRLVLAIFISIVITRPIELRLFESEIKGQITHDLIRDRTRLTEAINGEYADIPQTERATKELRDRQIRLQDRVTELENAALQELRGWDGTGVPGHGTQYERRLAEVDSARKELQSFNDQYLQVINENQNQIKSRRDEKDTKLREAENVVNKSPGLLKELEALSTLTMNSTAMLLASLFIILLFISLETAPILVKLFSSRGPYDDYLDSIEHEVHVTQQQADSDLNLQVNTAVAQAKQMSAYRSQYELQLYQQTLASLPTLVPKEFQAAQEKVARKAVERWVAGQLHNFGNHAVPAPISPTQPLTQAAAVAATQQPQNVTQTPAPLGAPVSAPSYAAASTPNGAASQAGAQSAAVPPAMSSTHAAGAQPPTTPTTAQGQPVATQLPTVGMQGTQAAPQVPSP